MSYKVVKRERERVCGFLLNEAEAISSEGQVSVSGPGPSEAGRGGGGGDGLDFYRKNRREGDFGCVSAGASGEVARGAG